MTYFLMVVCAFLISMSFIFITIELRSKFDKSFLLIGIANLLISSFCIIDVILQPQYLTIHWTQIQHIIVSFLPPFLVWHFMTLAKKVNFTIIKILFLLSFFFSALFISNVMLKPAGNEIGSTLLYNCTFAPYTFLVMVYLLFIIISGLKSSSDADKKVLYFYIAGLLILYSGGICDIISIFIGFRFFLPITSCSVLGAMGFSLLITATFAEKLSLIIKEREVTFAKLKDAYRELEEVQSLKELGQSTAIINHEIRNYASVISGYSELLKMNLSYDNTSRSTVDKIIECVVRLTAFSNDILEFSKSKILKNTIILDLSELIQNCIDLHFSKHKNFFTIEQTSSPITINGDRGKLERVFINIFKNSIEAGAHQITLRLTKNESVILCIVDDDGIGCSTEQLGSVFKSFYTTKKSEGGTGLGMCVVRSTIEVHGGYINAYTRNNPDTGTHGFSLHITFPAYELQSDPKNKKSNIILIKEGIQDLSTILRVFHNVLLSPHIVQNALEIDTRDIDVNQMSIVASPIAINQFRARFQKSGPVFALVKGPNDMVYVVDERAETHPTLFCEEFLFNQAKPT